MSPSLSSSSSSSSLSLQRTRSVHFDEAIEVNPDDKVEHMMIHPMESIAEEEEHSESESSSSLVEEQQSLERKPSSLKNNNELVNSLRNLRGMLNEQPDLAIALHRNFEEPPADEKDDDSFVPEVEEEKTASKKTKKKGGFFRGRVVRKLLGSKKTAEAPTIARLDRKKTHTNQSISAGKMAKPSSSRDDARKQAVSSSLKTTVSEESSPPPPLLQAKQSSSTPQRTDETIERSTLLAPSPTSVTTTTTTTGGASADLDNNSVWERLLAASSKTPPTTKLSTRSRSVPSTAFYRLTAEEDTKWTHREEKTECIDGEDDDDVVSVSDSAVTDHKSDIFVTESDESPTDVKMVPIDYKRVASITTIDNRVCNDDPVLIYSKHLGKTETALPRKEELPTTPAYYHDYDDDDDDDESVLEDVLAVLEMTTDACRWSWCNGSSTSERNNN